MPDECSMTVKAFAEALAKALEQVKAFAEALAKALEMVEAARIGKRNVPLGGERRA